MEINVKKLEMDKLNTYIRIFDDVLIKENESTFWSCKLAIIEKQKKVEKINSFDQDDQATYFDLIQELKADIELADRDITNYYYRMKAVKKLLKKLISKKKK